METGTPRLIARKEAAVGFMIFNHPERHNALSLDVWEAIPNVLAEFERDPEVRVVVFAGAGEKAFVRRSSPGLRRMSLEPVNTKPAASTSRRSKTSSMRCSGRDR